MCPIQAELIHTYRLIPKVSLYPGLAISPWYKDFHQCNISLHSGICARRNFCDPNGLVELLIQACSAIDDGLKTGGISMVAQGMDGIPGTLCGCVVVQGLHREKKRKYHNY